MINIQKYSNCSFIKGKLFSFEASLSKVSQIFSSILNIHKGPVLSNVLHQHFLKGYSGKFDDGRQIYTSGNATRKSAMILLIALVGEVETKWLLNFFYFN